MRKLTILALSAVLSASCAHQTTTPVRSSVDSPCKANDLPACEAGLADALHAAGDATTWAKAYVDARADALGPMDPWVGLWGVLEKAGPGSTVVLANPGGAAATEAAVRAEAQKLGADLSSLVVADTAPLPSPKQASEEELMVALARQAGVESITWVKDESVVRALGHDGLAPLLFKLPAVLTQPIDGADPATFHAAIARGIVMDARVNQAMAHLAQGAYREAAAIAVQLDAMVKASAADDASKLRADFLVRRCRSFGTELPKPEDDEEAPTNDPPKIWELGTPEQGPYAAWLRVMMAGNDTGKAWAKHRTTVAQWLGPDRLEEPRFGDTPEDIDRILNDLSPEPIPDVFSRPGASSHQASSGFGAGKVVLSLVVVLGLLLAGAYMMRDRVVGLVPQSQAVFDLIDGLGGGAVDYTEMLRFRDPDVNRTSIKNVPILSGRGDHRQRYRQNRRADALHAPQTVRRQRRSGARAQQADLGQPPGRGAHHPRTDRHRQPAARDGPVRVRLRPPARPVRRQR